jgi:hypothetical protein
MAINFKNEILKHQIKIEDVDPTMSFSLLMGSLSIQRAHFNLNYSF